MKNKAMCLILATCLMLTGSVTAFAGGPDDNGGIIFVGGVIPEDPISTAQQILQIREEPSYTTVQKDTLVNELMGHKSGVNKRSARTAAMTLPNFPYYYQQSGYWCIPATVQMTLKYVNGSSPSQSSLADSMGVDISSGVPLSEAVPFLNNEQSRAGYTQIWPGSVSAMRDDFYAIMKNENAPAIISTKFSTDEGYPYDMNYHHALCVTGQKADGESFRLHDPILNANVPESYYITPSNIKVGLKSYIA